ncbi:MAG: family 10 glycosylhydrolase [Candidatus Zhuqueibacterota bacterium]
MTGKRSAQMNRLSAILAIVLFFISPEIWPQTESEGRALWVTRWEYGTEDQIRALIRDTRDAHLNIVLFQVRGQADALYQSQFEPWSELLGGSDPGFDPLEVAIDEAHRNGLELHAYLNTFPVWSGSSAPRSPMHIYNTHPEWIMVNSSGVPMDPGAAGYATGSPGIPAFTDHVFHVFMDVLENYDIDGLHMDYIRYPSTAYSYDSTSVARFKQETGLSSPYASPYQWAQWRRNQVSNFVYRVYEGTMSRKPWVKVSAAVWGSYYDGYNERLQDPRDWLSKGKIDFIAPMTYTDNMSTYQSWVNNHARSTWGRHVYAGIDASGYVDTDDGVVQQIGICRLVQTQGSAIFSAGALDNSLMARLASDPYPTFLPAPTMDWKSNPVIVHTPLKDTEDITNPIVVTATITSPAPLVADSLLLFWSASRWFDPYYIEALSPVSDTTFEAAIPAQSNRKIYYYLLARNEAMYVEKLPRWAPIQTYSFITGADNIEPTIVYEPALVTSFYPIDSLSLSLSVSDNIGVDTNSVYVHYLLKDGMADSLKMHPDVASGNFTGALRVAGNPGDTLAYYFSAHDVAAKRNRVETDMFTIPMGLESFENGEQDWLAGEGWYFNSELAHSGDRSLKFALPQDFGANAARCFVTARPVNLQNLSVASLHIWSRFSLDADLLVGYVDVSADSGRTWRPVGQPLVGVANPWTEFYFPLSQFCGPGKPAILIRLRAQSVHDPGQEQLEWYIDDVSLQQDLAEVKLLATEPAMPEKCYLQQNYPNPFNQNTRLSFGLDMDETTPVSLVIFDVRGREVITLFNRELRAGHYAWHWDGRDSQHQTVPSGVYFYRIAAGSFVDVRKMLLVR